MQLRRYVFASPQLGVKARHGTALLRSIGATSFLERSAATAVDGTRKVTPWWQVGSLRRMPPPGRGVRSPRLSPSVEAAALNLPCAVRTATSARTPSSGCPGPGPSFLKSVRWRRLRKHIFRLTQPTSWWRRTSQSTSARNALCEGRLPPPIPRRKGAGGDLSRRRVRGRVQLSWS